MESRLFKRVRKAPAQAPGTIEFTGEQKVDRVEIKVIDYDAEQLEERAIDDLDDCDRYAGSDTVSWINVYGLHDTGLIRQLGDRFGIHPLVLEDIASTSQRPKVENYGDIVYLVARMLRFDEETRTVNSEQISLVIGRNFLLSFQERHGDVLEPVRGRIRRGNARIRRGGPGYLGYAILDAVVDHYFLVLDGLGEAIESLEDALLANAADDALSDIHALRREIVLVRRAVWPLREVVAGLDDDEVVTVGEELRPYLRDLHDHVLQVTDMVDSFREVLAGLQDLNLTNLSNRMNDVMKVLTIFASIFVPLTFLAGIFGMNFEHMPELGWRWSYPIFWGVSVVLVVGMLVFFRRQKWL